MSDVWVIILAGGSGTRFGKQKQFEEIAEIPIYIWAFKTAQEITTENIILVAPKEAIGEIVPNERTRQKLLKKGVMSEQMVEGGNTRSASVRAGIEKLKEMGANDTDIVLVHDAARPLATKEIYLDVIQEIRDGADAATPAIPITDTINTTDGEIVDRKKLLALQTPQGFRFDILKEIHENGEEATDDISLCLKHNKKVSYTTGDVKNLKITEPIDLKIAKFLLTQKPS